MSGPPGDMGEESFPEIRLPFSDPSTDLHTGLTDPAVFFWIRNEIWALYAMLRFELPAIDEKIYIFSRVNRETKIKRKSARLWERNGPDR